MTTGIIIDQSEQILVIQVAAIRHIRPIVQEIHCGDCIDKSSINGDEDDAYGPPHTRSPLGIGSSKLRLTVEAENFPGVYLLCIGLISELPNSHIHLIPPYPVANSFILGLVCLS